jgi:predicted dehydrogenase
VKQLAIGDLITHRVALSDVHKAYDLIAGATNEPFLGVVLQYPGEVDTSPRTASTPITKTATRRASVGFIGAGSFAGGTLLPALKKLSPQVSLRAICSSSGLTARDVATRHGFAAAVSTPEEILNDDAINVVFIATRHDSHAELTARALKSGKAVFVEKPLALDRDGIRRVMGAAAENSSLFVGFNRRFSPHTLRVLDELAGIPGARVVNIRVSAGQIPSDSWVHDKDVGGGRLLGEACHFVDLAQVLAGGRARPELVHAVSVGLPDPASSLGDNFCISLKFTNGSVASISYTAKGDTSVGKERVEVFAGGVTAVIDDFHTTTITRNRKKERFKTSQDKGHQTAVSRFIEAVTSGASPPTPLDEIEASSIATIAAAESIACGAAVDIQ